MPAETLRENKALRTVKVIVFTVVGVALMVGALCWAVSTRAFVARAASAPGVVIRLNAGGAHPQVRFTTSTGEVTEYPQGGMIWCYRVGDSVEVLYEPDTVAALGGVRAGIDEVTWRDADILSFETRFCRPAKGAGNVWLAARHQNGQVLSILYSDQYDRAIYEWHLAAALLIQHAYPGLHRLSNDGYDA